VTFVKFCGMTQEDDVRAACALGVNALGFVLWPQSPRCVAVHQLARLVRAMRPDVTPVGVFVSPALDELRAAQDAGIRVAQLHGPLDAEMLGNAGSLELWRARSLEDELDTIADGITLVLDAHDPERHGGTGKPIDWKRAATLAAKRRIVLAGGLTPDNVEEAIRRVRPLGVDVASGIEDRPGIKNRSAMSAFVAAVRRTTE
jgi:phosphoribosylanthranilate isomerase